jgi:plasmid stabilization system protein ParE
VEYTVVYSPEATEDLLHIYDYIAVQSAPQIALAYTERIAASCEKLSLFPERGTGGMMIFVPGYAQSVLRVASPLLFIWPKAPLLLTGFYMLAAILISRWNNRLIYLP